MATSLATGVGVSLWPTPSDDGAYAVKQWPEKVEFSSNRFSGAVDFHITKKYTFGFDGNKLVTYTHETGHLRAAGSTCDVFELQPTDPNFPRVVVKSSNARLLAFNQKITLLRAEIGKCGLEPNNGDSARKMDKLRADLLSALQGMKNVEISMRKEKLLVNMGAPALRSVMVPAKMVPVSVKKRFTGDHVMMMVMAPSLKFEQHLLYLKKLRCAIEVCSALDIMQNTLIEAGFVYTDVKAENIGILQQRSYELSTAVLLDYGGAANIARPNPATTTPEDLSAARHMVSSYFLPECEHKSVSIGAACAATPGKSAHVLGDRTWAAKKIALYLTACLFAQLFYGQDYALKHLFVVNNRDPVAAAANLDLVRARLGNDHESLLMSPEMCARFGKVFQVMCARLSPNPHDRQ
jgi:hypothetical protein